jgi:hypothetical protein
MPGILVMSPSSEFLHLTGSAFLGNLARKSRSKIAKRSATPSKRFDKRQVKISISEMPHEQISAKGVRKITRMISPLPAFRTTWPYFGLIPYFPR